MTEINDVTAKKLQQLQKKPAKKSSSKETAQNATPPRAQDSVEIGSSQATQPEIKDVTISKEDMERYTTMLSEMPEIRDSEVARVEAILAEDGYGPDALSVVAQRLLEEGA